MCSRYGFDFYKPRINNDVLQLAKELMQAKDDILQLSKELMQSEASLY